MIIPLLVPAGKARAAESPPASANISTAAAEPGSAAPGFLDQFQQTIANRLDQSARWVDGFFGEERLPVESKAASGQLLVRVTWQDYKGIKVRTRLRASLPLDRLSRRLNAFVGQGDANDVVQDKNQGAGGTLSGKDNHWLFGVGYVPPASRARHFTIKAGAILSWPLDPYARVNYRREWAPSDRTTLTFNENVFWKRSEQFGFSSSVDYARQLRDDLVLRLPNWAKVSGATSGVEYDSRIHLYQKLREHRALLYGALLQGDTHDRVPVRQYGTYVVYRQPMFREWLLGEVIAGATLLRENDWAQRKFSCSFGVGFVLAFEKKAAPAESVVANLLLSRRR